MQVYHCGKCSHQGLWLAIIRVIERVFQLSDGSNRTHSPSRGASASDSRCGCSSRNSKLQLHLDKAKVVDLAGLSNRDGDGKKARARIRRAPQGVFELWKPHADTRVPRFLDGTLEGLLEFPHEHEPCRQV